MGCGEKVAWRRVDGLAGGDGTGWVLRFSAEVTRDTQTIPREPQKGLKNTVLLEAPRMQV